MGDSYVIIWYYARSRKYTVNDFFLHIQKACRKRNTDRIEKNEQTKDKSKNDETKDTVRDMLKCPICLCTMTGKINQVIIYLSILDKNILS